MNGKQMIILAFAVLAALTVGLTCGHKIGTTNQRRVDRAVIAGRDSDITELRKMADNAIGEATILRQMVTFTGKASHYGKAEHGNITANNERFSRFAFTAASKIFPFNSRWRVINLENWKETIIRVNDDGPNISGRIIDLSDAAAAELGMIAPGTANVMLTPDLSWLAKAGPIGKPGAGD
jgi:rare lipoprotein A (peptidoglycan hydrolase)